MDAKRDLIMAVNVPFCFHRCGIYDQGVFVRDRLVRDAYFAALLRELGSAAEELESYRLLSLLLHGGIPTILADMQLPVLVGEIVGRVEVSEDFQICVQTAPGCIGINVLSRLKDHGSVHMEFMLGTTHPFELEALGRDIGEGDMAVSCQIMEFAKHKDYGIDLCYGVPGQTLSSVDESVEKALSFGATSVGLHPIRVCEGSFLHRRLVVERGRAINHVHHRAVPDAQTAFALFEEEDRLLREAGFAPYTSRRYAKDGCVGLHHVLQREGVDLMGLGVAACSTCSGYTVENTPDLDRYISGAGDPGAVIVRAVPRSTAETMRAYVMGAVDLPEGLSLDECRRRFGEAPEESVWQPLVERGLVEVDRTDGERVCLTERGRCFADEVQSHLANHIACCCKKLDAD